MPWIDIREPHTEKLLARLDPERWLLEIARRGVKTVIDLAEYIRAPQSAKESDNEHRRELSNPA